MTSLTGLADDLDCANLSRAPESAVNREIAVGDRSLPVSASFGIAIGQQDAGDADSLLKCADLALDRARNDGKGTFHLFEPGLDEQASRRRRMEIDLRRAIATLADALGIETMAEGVESLDDAEILRREGCNMIQGYLISRPVSSADVADLLAMTAPLRKVA